MRAEATERHPACPSLPFQNGTLRPSYVTPIRELPTSKSARLMDIPTSSIALRLSGLEGQIENEPQIQTVSSHVSMRAKVAVGRVTIRQDAIELRAANAKQFCGTHLVSAEALKNSHSV